MNMDAILITGPTASGKSALALELAKRHGGVVVNADSMQVYDTLRVLTARPSVEDMEDIPHLLYGHVPAGGAYSTGDWLRQAETVIAALRTEGRLPVFVGGTGLYFKALTGGLSEMPTVPDEIRERFRSRLLEEGPESLHAELSHQDADGAALLQPGDGQRIVRALEVLEATGTPIRAFQGKPGKMVIDPARARKIVVQPQRAVLYKRIDRRFQAMMESGAVEEVRAVLALRLKPEMPVMKAIGVSQIAALLEGRMTPEEVIEKSATATRQYAKRQMTWFRNQMDESWERQE